MSERSNAGYIIISAIRVGDTEYVLGENSKAPARFVTWMCRNESDYFWGRYTDDPVRSAEPAGPGRERTGGAGAPAERGGGPA